MSSAKELFQHRFDNVEDYLHHRAPYLLVDQIERLDPETVVTLHHVRDDAYFVKGHFPGAPIMPGAMMQEFSTQSAGILIAGNFNPMDDFNTHDPHHNEFALGVLVRIKRAKYLSFARPGEVLRAQVQLESNGWRPV